MSIPYLFESYPFQLNLTISIRLLIYYHVSAVTVLLANINQNPRHEMARSDLSLVKPSLRLLNSLKQKLGSEEKESLYTNCVELERAARNVLEGENIQQIESEHILEESQSRFFS